MYHFNPVDFNVGDLKAIEVIAYTLGDGDIIENFEILFEGKKYTKLKEYLSKSYEITYEEEPFVGDKECDFWQKGNNNPYSKNTRQKYCRDISGKRFYGKAFITEAAMGFYKDINKDRA